MTTLSRAASTSAAPAGTPVTCQAIVSYAQGDYGFVPVTCSQSVGLVRIIDAAGVRHLACSRWGHAAEIIRRFGEPAAPAEPRPGKASSRCESGGRDGCTCVDVCW